MPRDLAGKLVLDAGCGGGRYARLLLEHGAKVVGADLSSAVNKAQALCGGPDQPNLAIIQANLNQLPLAEGVFDLVFFDRRPPPRPRPEGSVRGDRAPGQAGGSALGLALPPEHSAAGVGQLSLARGLDPTLGSRPGADLRGDGASWAVCRG